MPVIIDSSAEIDGVRLRQQSGDPAAPAASHWLLYAKAAGLFIEDSAAVVTGPFGTGGGGGSAVTIPLTNQSGGTVNLGDVVQIDQFNASSFTTAFAVAHDTTQIFGVVADASIASLAVGNITVYGLVSQINLSNTAAIGDTLYSAGSANQATADNPMYEGSHGGTFGIALDTGTTPPAFIFNPPVLAMETLLLTTTGVDLNSASAHVIYFGPETGSVIITRVVIRNASTSLTTAAFSIGFTGAAYNDVIANATHTELTGNTLYTVLQAKAGAAVGGVNAQLKLLTNTLQGAPATVDVDVFGYILP